MSKPIILTGLRANNDLHIGNYLGALLPLVDMATQKADEYQINLFIPDLHSFTTPIDHSKLQEAIMRNLQVFVAAGLPLDHDDVHIYRQSYVSAHSELTWILDCFTGFGELSRMTQFKDKALLERGNQREQEILQQMNQYARSIGATAEAEARGSQKYRPDFVITTSEGEQLIIEVKRGASEASVGLFNYPVLMAADILLYGAEYVPVGDDQTQHLEFTRDIAERMNKKFDQRLFTVPKPVKEQHEFFGKDQGLRIRDLQNPAKKMSKSDESGKGVIFLTDTPEEARKKIMGAETDSLGGVQYDYEKRPGISNLLDMLKLFGGNPDEFIGQDQYGALKTAVADKVSEFLADFQSKLAEVDDSQILRKLEADEAKMREIADQRLLEVQQAVGLRPR